MKKLLSGLMVLVLAMIVSVSANAAQGDTFVQVDFDELNLNGSIAIEGVNVCVEAADIPTLSEWGLVAMAGVLGIVGFIVARRRMVKA